MMGAFPFKNTSHHGCKILRLPAIRPRIINALLHHVILSLWASGCMPDFGPERLTTQTGLPEIATQTLSWHPVSSFYRRGLTYLLRNGDQLFPVFPHGFQRRCHIVYRIIPCVHSVPACLPVVLISSGDDVHPANQSPGSSPFSSCCSQRAEVRRPAF